MGSIRIEMEKPVILNSFVAWCTPEFYQALRHADLNARPLAEPEPAMRHGPRNRWGALN